jgi:gliding motility-associated-like protein
VLKYQFSVFDRWGLEIFKTSDPKSGWDGTFKGKNAQQDVYVYKVTYLNVFRIEKHITGTFTLIR